MAEYTDIGSMSPGLPTGTAQLSQADDHLRGIKTAVKNTFPNVLGVVTSDTAELNSLDGLNSATSIEDRFTELEAYFDYTGTQMTVQQMQMLWDLETSSSVESRLASLEYKVSEVSYEEITALKGYDVQHSTGPYIENRFQKLETDVGVLQTDNSAMWTAINYNTVWRAEREGIISNSNLYRIASYLGVALPLGYNNDLGSDFQLVTNKVAQLEYLVGTGANPGLVTWMSLKANLDGGNGGISITNTLDATDRFGFIMTGLYPGTVVDFRFFDDAANDWGGLCSAVNANKLIMVSGTGEAFCDLQLGGANDNFGVGGGRLPTTGSGRIEIQGTYQDANGNFVTSYQRVYVAYY